jgi:hypothetical protein
MVELIKRAKSTPLADVPMTKVFRLAMGGSRPSLINRGS